MVDETEGVRFFADEAVESLTEAQRTVERASEEVDAIGRHFRESTRPATTPESLLKFLESQTRKTPFAMLGLAFIAGVIFVRR